jgi:hypothetical protein
VSNLGSITIGKRSAGQGNEENQASKNQAQTGSMGRHKASSDKPADKLWHR